MRFTNPDLIENGFGSLVELNCLQPCFSPKHNNTDINSNYELPNLTTERWCGRCLTSQVWQMSV